MEAKSKLMEPHMPVPSEHLKVVVDPMHTVEKDRLNNNNNSVQQSESVGEKEVLDEEDDTWQETKSSTEAGVTMDSSDMAGIEIGTVIKE